MVLPVPAGLAGQTLTDAQTTAWAAQAGFSGADLTIAVAVSITENSSRKIDSVHTNADGSRDYGEWQINDLAHADLFKQWPNWWTVTNANMAHAVWSSSGWDAWTTYKDGTYRNNMVRATAATITYTGNNILETSPVPLPGTGQNADQATAPTETPLDQIGNSVAAIASKLFAAGTWIANPHNWVRVAMVLLGGAIVIGGLLYAVKGEVVPSIVSDVIGGQVSKAAGNAKGTAAAGKVSQ